MGQCFNKMEKKNQANFIIIAGWKMLFGSSVDTEAGRIELGIHSDTGGVLGIGKADNGHP